MSIIFEAIQIEADYDIAGMKIKQTDGGKFQIAVDGPLVDGASIIEFGRDTLLDLARSIIQKLEVIEHRTIGGDVLLVPLNAPVVENDIVKIAR